MTPLAALQPDAPGRGWRPVWTDVLWALVLALPALLTSRHGLLGQVLGVVVALPVLWRRQAPIAMFVAAWLAAAVQGLAAAPSFSDCALLVILYTIAVQEPRRAAVAAWGALEVGVAAAAAKFAHPGFYRVIEAFVAMSAMAIAALVIGINVGNRRQVLAALRERAERLDQEREQELALARFTERSRIAREMHDVVAHNLSVMLALCDGAAYHLRDDPERVRAVLDQASRTGRQALAEMRQLLGVLREEEPAPGAAGDARASQDLAPQPGVGAIGGLVDQVRAAGLPVVYTVRGALAGSPPGMELAIYRIVQEALTNTLKHAGPGATATVCLTYGGDRVEIDVSDTGLSRPSAAPRLGGGLRGMRERAALYGGTLEAGPAADGGWRVHATLSIPADAPAAPPVQVTAGSR